MTLFIGLMSGTSMDGIDAALVDIPDNKLVAGLTKKYSKELMTRLNQVLSGKDLTLASICQLNTLIGKEFAQAALDLLQQARISIQEVKAIGSHGQTLCHDTTSSIPYTLQLGCGHTISSMTQTTVVADFRTRDLVNGGQGAPFAPLYHQQLFAKLDSPVAVVNIGGISNISLIQPQQATRGWDVGPGNCLMDAWINKHQGLSYDEGGTWAKQGKILQNVLDKLMADPFVALAAPKSIGKEYYSLNWLQGFLQADYQPVDVQATLLAFTVHCIAQAIPTGVKQVYLCGGGTHNNYLLASLAALLPGVTVQSSAQAGVDPDYLEAMMFAWLASQTVEKIPVDLTQITGSRGLEILGAVYPASPI